MGRINEATTVVNLENDEFINIVLSDGTNGKIKKADLFPIASTITAGLMSDQDRKCYPSYSSILRLIKRSALQSHKSLRIRFRNTRYLNLRISIYGKYSYGFAIGRIVKNFALYFNATGSINGGSNSNTVEYASPGTANVYYIGDAHADDTYIYIEIYNKENGPNDPFIVLESFYPLSESNIEFIENATDLPSTSLNNRNETMFQLRT
jgi:hypothetical protein